MARKLWHMGKYYIGREYYGEGFGFDIGWFNWTYKPSFHVFINYFGKKWQWTKYTGPKEKRKIPYWEFGEWYMEFNTGGRLLSFSLGWRDWSYTPYFYIYIYCLGLRWYWTRNMDRNMDEQSVEKILLASTAKYL